MKIIGFNFDKIKIERKNKPEGKLQINSNINIKDITQEKVELIKEQIPIKFDFEFLIKYNPDVAEVLFTGAVIVLLEKEQSKEILKKWKTKKIADEIRVPLFNFLLTKCSIRALQLEEEFDLPLHIPLPQVRAQEENTNSSNNRNYAG